MLKDSRRVAGCRQRESRLVAGHLSPNRQQPAGKKFDKARRRR